MYEYGGCIYPEGILDSNMVCAFNHEQIEKIHYLGLNDAENKEFQKKLDEYLKREDIKQKDLLKRQQMIMLRYLIVLNERLDNWEE